MKTKYPIIKKLNDFFTTSEEFDDLVGKLLIGAAMICFAAGAIYAMII